MIHFLLVLALCLQNTNALIRKNGRVRKRRAEVFSVGPVKNTYGWPTLPDGKKPDRTQVAYEIEIRADTLKVELGIQETWLEKFGGTYELYPLTDGGTQKIVYKGVKKDDPAIVFAFGVMRETTTSSKKVSSSPTVCDSAVVQKGRSCNNQWLEEYATKRVSYAWNNDDQVELMYDEMPVVTTIASFTDDVSDKTFYWIIQPFGGKEIAQLTDLPYGERGEPLKEQPVNLAKLLYTLMRDLEFIHMKRILHRDLKGDNALTTVKATTPGETNPDKMFDTRLIDLGLMVDVALFEAVRAVPLDSMITHTKKTSSMYYWDQATAKTAASFYDWIPPQEENKAEKAKLQEKLNIDLSKFIHSPFYIGHKSDEDKTKPLLDGIRSTLYLTLHAGVQGSRPKAPLSANDDSIPTFPMYAHDMWHLGIMIAEMVDGHPWGAVWIKKVAMAAASKVRSTVMGGVKAVLTTVRKVLKVRSWSDRESLKDDHASMQKQTVSAMLTYIANHIPQKAPIDRPSPAEITVLIKASLNAKLREGSDPVGMIEKFATAMSGVRKFVLNDAFGTCYDLDAMADRFTKEMSSEQKVSVSQKRFMSLVCRREKCFENDPKNICQLASKVTKDNDEASRSALQEQLHNSEGWDSTNDLIHTGFLKSGEEALTHAVHVINFLCQMECSMFDVDGEMPTPVETDYTISSHHHHTEATTLETEATTEGGEDSEVNYDKIEEEVMV